VEADESVVVDDHDPVVGQVEPALNVGKLIFFATDPGAK
jgi:hypothetical protein